MEKSPNYRPRSRLFSAAILVTLPLLAVALIAFVVLKGCERIARAPMEMTATVVQDFIRQFERNITLSIQSSITSIRATDGDILVLSEIETTEIFREDDSFATPDWTPFTGKQAIPGTTTQSEIRVPATFRYYVKLSEPISVKIIQGANAAICVVTAPELRPLLPASFDTTRMDVRVDTGWLRFNNDEARDKIIVSLTPRLNARAGEHTQLARDKAREAFAKFVRQWVQKNNFPGNDEVREIIVKFPGEK